MALAHHLIFGCYGFWLPNDPRGSWSQYVGNRELLSFGDATYTPTRDSLAGICHDHAIRFAAKQAMHYEAVVLSGLQARAVGRGIAEAVAESRYSVYACSIMPDHVHMVVRRHQNKPKQMIGHFKGRATQRLKKEGIHPLAQCDGPPSPWGRGGWFVHLDDEDNVLAAIGYVNRNPIEAGLPEQQWSFVASILT